jgi:hypothetical protein
MIYNSGNGNGEIYNGVEWQYLPIALDNDENYDYSLFSHIDDLITSWETYLDLDM